MVSQGMRRIGPLVHVLRGQVVMNHDNGCRDGLKSSGLKSLLNSPDKETDPIATRFAYFGV